MATRAGSSRKEPETLTKTALTRTTSPILPKGDAKYSALWKYLRPEEIIPVDVESRVYPNGLRVISEQVTGAASVAIGVWINAGSRHETADNAGIAHFIEHMVFKGTAGKSMRVIMRAVESRGGFLNAFTTKEHTCYYAWTRTPYLSEATSILFDLATRPKFTERDIKREKGVVLEEIRGIEDEPDELAFDIFEHELFGRHSLGRPIIGTEKSVSSFTRADLLAFHRAHYRAKNVTIIASGGQRHSEVFKAIEKVLHHLPVDETDLSDAVSRFRSKRAGERHAPRAGGQQAHIILGRRTEGALSKGHIAASAVVTLLGGGMGSRLNLRLREELGLAYEAQSFLGAFRDTATVGLYTATAVENKERVISEMRKALRSLFSKPISRAELERTKEQMIGGLVLSLESVTNRMMRAGAIDLYHHEYKPVEAELEQVAALTLEEVREAASKLFEDESSLTLVSVVPAELVKENEG